MTQKEFLQKVINANISKELNDYAQASIDGLNARNQKRRETLTPAQKENLEIKKQIVAILDKPMVASEIAEKLNISTQKVTALCKQLADNGEIKVGEVKVKNKGTLKSYSK